MSEPELPSSAVTAITDDCSGSHLLGGGVGELGDLQHEMLNSQPAVLPALRGQVDFRTLVVLAELSLCQPLFPTPLQA